MNVGGLWDHGDGVQDEGCDRMVGKAWTKGGGLYNVGQCRLTGERGTVHPACPRHQEEGLLQLMLGHEQRREALLRNILKEEREESKDLCTAWSMAGETTHPPLKERKHPGKHPLFEITPQLFP